MEGTEDMMIRGEERDNGDGRMVRVSIDNSHLRTQQRRPAIVRLLFKGDEATVRLRPLGTPTLSVLSFKLALVGNELLLELWGQYGYIITV